MEGLRMSLTASSSVNIRSLDDEEADHNMLQDLQLAAELGKTLLERNKELETNLKAHQTTIDEQAQEIEYLKKQNAALREVTDSRLKVYEQLEVSIQDLERANHRLVVDNTANKKLVKSQCLTIENLEAKCEELQKTIEELKTQHENYVRKQQSKQNGVKSPGETSWTTISHDGSIHQTAAKSPSKMSPGDLNARVNGADDDEVNELLRQLQETRSQRAREQKKVSELRQQLEGILKDNRALEEQLNEWRTKAQDMKNLQDEINTLEEVRQGKLCGRCLRGYDVRPHDELSLMLDAEEDDDLSLAESYLNSQRDSEILVEDNEPTDNDSKEPPKPDSNPYRVLVEKYEALLEVQRQPVARKKTSATTPPCMSLQEELEMSGDFNSLQTAPSDTATEPKTNGFRRYNKKPFSGTPTDFSEAETSSSGFSDETSNKETQTDGRLGSLLCSIADGEDCKFSIYDDNSPFESRFRKTPEYRQLFSEIFCILKRAAEAKDEGEKLPLLDNTVTASAHREDQNPEQDQSQSQDQDQDDTQSVLSSVISSVVSEPVIRVHASTPEKENDKNLGRSETAPRHPQRRHHLDYLSIQVRKKNTAKKHHRKIFNEQSDVISNSKINQSQSHSHSQSHTQSLSPSPSKPTRRIKFRPLTAAEQDGTNWNGNTIHVFASRNKSERSNNRYSTNHNVKEHNGSFDYKEYKPSSASEEVARLRRLEMSYAEALRTPNKSKAANCTRRY
ncbi:cerebellar degeneration-related protein 2 isoform X2 [Microplitis mediator]|uniref:cerebellar degeneration-related protein 2 isoform X2 n=1 Tax=Microplitis mediator TaxID=375433 RepID=UPI00255735E8|nr:cerebellar degeneration-related protein 2 isoform X2 [Microplitis mediator]